MLDGVLRPMVRSQRIAHEGKTLPDRRSFRNRFLFQFDEEQDENC